MQPRLAHGSTSPGRREKAPPERTGTHAKDEETSEAHLDPTESLALIVDDLLAAIAPPKPPAAAAGKALRTLRSCLPYLTTAGEERMAEVSFLEMAWLTRAVGANEGKGYRPQTLFNAEQAYKYPTAPVVGAYAQVAAAARRPGWLEQALGSQGANGRWRRGEQSAPMAGVAQGEVSPSAGPTPRGEIAGG